MFQKGYDTEIRELEKIDGKKLLYKMHEVIRMGNTSFDDYFNTVQQR